ncbi:MAG: non-ribosomal peptide synthetase [Leptolyngbya foveolarum]|uniref:Non-ribosomal peptide synthetase n=1 Tax=Leptolyngbya foveolarum TaxID=47253 RepID=A0A2W4VT73_9CYAN|nr:MAG: non-ribosomal peptide synthetase [Leptolyngbya foveolarum]
MIDVYQPCPQLTDLGHTWVSKLRQRSQVHPNQTAFTFLPEGEIEAIRWTYGELDRRSRAIAAKLQSLNLSGERALLLYPAGLDYIAAFLGCLYAGVVAVPAYPPQNARKTPRIQAISHDAEAAISLTTEAKLPKIQKLMGNSFQHQPLQWLATDTLEHRLAEQWQMPTINSDTLAFLQYTSGSTGSPKGVMLSHRNLLHNAAETYRMMGHSPDSCFASWLPLYHDMGLIGGILQPLYGGFPCVLMSPISFLQRPYRWLKTISDYRATTSGGPNFAYDLCVERITPEQRKTLDLSCWKVAFNGAEPIRALTLTRFANAFAGCGFRADTFYPCYGLAEGSLMVSGCEVARDPVIQAFQVADLKQNRVMPTPAVLAGAHPIGAAPMASSQTLVSSGRSLQTQQIAIVNPETLTRCGETDVGEIWVNGSSVGKGYWKNPHATADTFQADLSDSGKDSGDGSFLRTGDLGFLHNGELFVTGRLKDLIILRGRNLYPQDLEQAAETSHPAFRIGGSAAFTITVEDPIENRVEENERLVVVQELEFRQQPDQDAMTAAVRQAIAEIYEVEVYVVALVKPGRIPKTTSGKIQRRACRQDYLSGELTLLCESILTLDEPLLASPMAGLPKQSSQQQVIDLSLEHLLAQASEERPALLADYLQQTIARSLKRSPDQIRRHHPLTSLGLDSLRVMSLQDKLSADWGIEISITDFFEGITPAQIAQQILDRSASEPDHPNPTQPLPSTDIPGLTASQSQIFFLQQLQPESPTYNIAISLDFQGPLEVEALRQSLQNIVDRHPALRSHVVLQDGHPTLVSEPTIELPWTHIDLQHWDRARQDAEVQRLRAFVQQAFTLTQGPLFRMMLCQFSQNHHQLLFTIHHLIFDGSSAKIFFQELTDQYQACVTSRSAASLSTQRSPGRLQGADLPKAYLQPEITSPRWRQKLDYWQQQLAGTLPILQLPADYPRPATQTFRGARESFKLPLTLVNSLNNLARQERATLFMVLLAAFKAWLYRYTGQTDLLVGSALAQRTATERQPIGCSINTLVFRTHPASHVRFRDFLHQVRHVALEAYSHGEIPFQRLVETLQPERDPSYSPIVQVMVDLQQLPTQLDWPDLSVDLAEVETGTAKFDLTLSMIETEEGIQGHWEYNTDLFSRATICRMMTHFQRLLSGVAAAPMETLAALPLLSAHERQQLLVDWNQTAVPIPQQPFHRLFEAQVDRTPEAIALRYETQSLTYHNLNQRANQLAHKLQGVGVKNDQLVGVCLPRSPALLISLLAILKAGGAYVPLDPSYPRERLDFMIQDSQVEVLLSQSTTRLQLELGQNNTADHALQHVIELDTEATAIAEQPATNLVAAVTLNQLAYIIYTSGSTGKPKGVMIEQRGLLNYLIWCQQAYPLTAGQGSLVHSSVSFDMTITGLFSPLLTGQTVELLSEADGLEALAMRLRDQSNSQSAYSLIKITPAQLELLSHQLSPTEIADRTHAFIIGGENLSAKTVNIWRNRASQTQLINEYGPTETVVGCCVYTIQSDDLRSGSVPIGRPIINTQMYILDDQHQPVPVGVVGELYIGGAGVAKGYFNRPELTTERFINNPFAANQKAETITSRLYKTGDLARYRPDGVIEFLGRIDHQVKIRGYRVELGEIEAALSQHPSVREAVVIAREDDPGRRRLVAYVVSEADVGETGIADLREWLRSQVPDYMVPAAFVQLDELPLTVNGKVNRQALPRPSGDRPELSNAYVAPKADLERAIAHIWQALLGLDQVGLQDNFFDLGGHSLLLVQVQNQLQTQLDRQILLVDLFRYPTIQAIAAYLDQPSEGLVSRIQAQVDRQKIALQRRRHQRQQRSRQDAQDRTSATTGGQHD